LQSCAHACVRAIFWSAAGDGAVAGIWRFATTEEHTGAACKFDSAAASMSPVAQTRRLRYDM
jgi:hypothetical protein